MKTAPKNVVTLTMLYILIFVLFSCSKDSELLLDAVLDDPEISLEEKETTVEEGFEERTFTFSPINDAYLQNGQGHNQSIIRLQEDYRTSYLMFDLSAVNGKITDAVLQFSVDGDEGDGSIAIHKGATTNWNEENLTITNAPAIEVQLGTITKAYNVGASEKVILDVNNLKSESTTLIMTHSAGNDLAFASKEHIANKGPKLEITYQAPEGSPVIPEQEAENNQEDTTQDSTQNDGSENNSTQNDTNTEGDTTSENNNNNTASTEGAFYVTTSGSASNDGRSEATAWSIEHAFETAVAGDVVYIKAGNYGSKHLVVDNSGNTNNPISFIGYTNTPGDLASNEGSTFNYGDNLNSSMMPLLSSSNGDAITIFEPFIHLENIQITGYNKGIMAHSFANNFSAKNLIITELGNQNEDSYDGWGMDIRGSYSNITNSFVLNATAEAIKLSGASNSKITHSAVYADNATNPTDYYFFLAGGTNNSIVENCHAQREQGLWHGGHGFNIKDNGAYNTFKNCTAIRTNFELTYVGVHHNTIDGGAIYGINTSAGEWHAVMSIIGGAHDNLIKNLYIQDTWTAITLAAYDDRTGADASLGTNNAFENVVVKNTNRILNIGGGTNYNSKAKNYTFKNCDFSNFDSVAIVYYEAENFKFENCNFEYGQSFIYQAQDQYAPYSDFDVSWINCKWTNINFEPPN